MERECYEIYESFKLCPEIYLNNEVNRIISFSLTNKGMSLCRLYSSRLRSALLRVPQTLPLENQQIPVSISAAPIVSKRNI